MFLNVHLFLRKAVEFRAKVVGFYFEQVGLCIVVSAFDFQCFGFLQRKENFNKEEKVLRPESGLKFSWLRSIKWSSARCRPLRGEKWCEDRRGRGKGEGNREQNKAGKQEKAWRNVKT